MESWSDGTFWSDGTGWTDNIFPKGQVMGFPYDFHENFETGTKGSFGTEVDTGSRLDYPGPDQLLHDMLAVFPHKGGYCMRVNLGKNTSDAYVPCTVSWAADASFGRFEFLIGDDVQVGNVGDIVDIMALNDSGTDRGALCLSRDATAGLILGVRGPSGSIDDFLSISQGDWVCVETQIDVDTSGFVVIWVGNDRVKLAGLTSSTMIDVRFGALNQTGDFAGHIYFDEVCFDSARLYPDYGAHNLRLDGETMWFGKSGFAFIGEGHITGCQLIDGGSGGTTKSVLKVYDTDDVTYSETMKKEHLTVTANDGVAYSQGTAEGQYLFKVDHGCYVVLEGDTVNLPQALIRMGSVDELHLADVMAEMQMHEEDAEAA